MQSRFGSATCFAAWVLCASCAAAQDFSLVPGEVISYLESPERTINGSILDSNDKYLSSPSITVMPNGDYIASLDIFGDGTTNNTTLVYRSTDQGLTWTYQSVIAGAFASTVFEHNGDLYLWGYREYHKNSTANADVLIRKSTDNGVTWTTPTNATNGLLLDTNLYGQANTPTIYNGRIWIALSGKSVMSAQISSDLLQTSSWTASDSANTSATPWGGNELSITEAQVVSSPRDGVVVMPKVSDIDHSILIRVNNPSQVVNFAAPEDYIDLPGGGKKFAVQFDPVSDRYYIVSNPILPEHANSSIENGLIRNTAALLSSTDLRHWDVEKIFLYSSELDHNLGFFQGTFGEGFQYMNFVIEDDDLLVVSRTALDTEGDRSQAGQNIPPRGHDSNLITFHRIEDFRSAGADQKLVVDTANNRVLRYETTGFNDAPLGHFQLGTSFMGQPINQPDGVAQDINGDVYIHEAAGRIMRFDALGNFISVVGSLPGGLTFSSAPLPIAQPAFGERGWVNSGGGSWDELSNWYYWGRPDTNYEVAVLGSAIPSQKTLTMSGDYTFKGFRFRSDNKYIINGPGSVTLAAGSGNAIIDVQRGIHELQVDVTLDSDTDMTVAAGSRLFFKQLLDLNGRTLAITGSGQRNIDGTFVMNGGQLLTDGLNQISFGSGIDAQLDGTFVFMPSPGTILGVGGLFSLFNGVVNLNDVFDLIVMPDLDDGLAWDLTSLMVNGTVTITGALTGDLNGDGFVGINDLNIVLSNWNQSVTPGSYALGDPSGDGFVGIEDLNSVLGNWNAGTPPAAAPTVPEPATLTILLVVSACRNSRRPK